MDVGLKTKLQMKVSDMIKKLSLMLLVFCSLSVLSPSVQSHDESRPPRRSPERPPQGEQHNYHFNNFRPYFPPEWLPPRRFARPYYRCYGPRRRGSEFYLRFGGSPRRQGGFGIGFRNFGW